jgi:hypothetical protein
MNLPLRPLVSTALALAALTACAHDGAPPLPLPPGWDAPPGAVAWREDPLWGVPDFSAPSASDCRRPPALREVPGGAWPQQLGRAAPRERRAEAARADGAALADLESSRSSVDAAHGAVAPSSPPQQQLRPLAATVTAGVIDDNADFASYLAYRERSAHVPLRRRDVQERYRIDVRDAADRPVPDAELAVAWRGDGREPASSVPWARSDAGGSAWLHPRAVLPPQAEGHALEVQVRIAGGAPQVARATLQRGQKHHVTLRLPSVVPPARPRLDLAFLVDATGSMGDEIAKLKASVASVAAQIAAMPGRPELCLALVAYRDRGDAFLHRIHDFTDRLGDFQSALNALQADAGGDYPEALDEALAETVHGLQWRGAGATRLVVLIADAPPQRRRGVAPFDASIAAALAKGIKLHAVAASGLDARGEGVFRHLAQYGGGHFVFLTYRDAHDPGSGPGSDTSHDVHGYSVESLDRLIVRLVRDELARRPT